MRYQFKAKDHWRYQKRDPHSGRWVDATPAELLDPSVPTTGLVQMVRTNSKPGSGMGRAVDLPKFDVQANGRTLGSVEAHLSKPLHVSQGGGSQRLFHYRKPGGRLSPGYSTQKNARDYLLRDIGHDNSRPVDLGVPSDFDPTPRQGYSELGPGPGPGESMAESARSAVGDAALFKPGARVSSGGRMGTVRSISKVGEGSDWPTVQIDFDDGSSSSLFSYTLDAPVGSNQRVGPGESMAESANKPTYLVSARGQGVVEEHDSLSEAQRAADFYEGGSVTEVRAKPAGVQEMDPDDDDVEEMKGFYEAAKAYSDLGSSVQEQMDEYLDIVNNGLGNPSDSDLNPNAIALIENWLDTYPEAAEMDMEQLREYEGLGWAVQEQLGAILDGDPFSEQNPNALEMISRLLRGMGFAGNNLANQINDHLNSQRKKSMDLQFYEAAFSEVELQLQHAGMNTKNSSDWTVRRLEKAMTEASKIPDRGKLSDDQFALPEERSYPIPDEAHGRLAIGRCKGKPEESKVRSAVVKKFPSLKEYAAEVLDSVRA